MKQLGKILVILALGLVGLAACGSKGDNLCTRDSSITDTVALKCEMPTPGEDDISHTVLGDCYDLAQQADPMLPSLYRQQVAVDKSGLRGHSCVLKYYTSASDPNLVTSASLDSVVGSVSPVYSTNLLERVVPVVSSVTLTPPPADRIPSMPEDARMNVGIIVPDGGNLGDTYFNSSCSQWIKDAYRTDWAFFGSVEGGANVTLSAGQILMLNSLNPAARFCSGLSTTYAVESDTSLGDVFLGNKTLQEMYNNDYYTFAAAVGADNGLVSSNLKAGQVLVINGIDSIAK